MARARESALSQYNCGSRLCAAKCWAQDLAIFSKIGAHRPLPHSLLAFFVRFVSNDKAMDPKNALTILPFALAKFVSARNRVSDFQLTRIGRDLTSP